MSEQEHTVTSQSSAEVQKQAEDMGWIPPSRFKGDPERFVDADVYIKRGEEVLPIVREQNKRLHAELTGVKQQAQQTAVALKAAQDAIAQMEELHTVATQRAVEDAKKQVKAQLAAASEAGDHEGVAELTDKLVKMNTPEPAVAKPVAPAPVFTPPPELAEWNAENPWFGTHKRKTALALAIAQELREGGETAQGRPFFEMIKAEVDKELGVQQPRGDKVEGARSGAEGEGRQSGKKGYASMPIEARAACDADARRFVGEGKKYKTQQDWRNRYAEIYFGE